MGIPLEFIECNVLGVVQGINDAYNSAISDPVCLDIKAFMGQVSYGTCRCIPRNGNKVAHMLASFASNNPSEVLWIDDCPRFISSFVFDDLMK